MRIRNRRTVDNRKRVRGAVPSTYRYVIDGATYLALKHRHGRVIYWHVYEAQFDADGRGRRGAHVVAVRKLDDIPGAIDDWLCSSIDELVA